LKTGSVPNYKKRKQKKKTARRKRYVRARNSGAYVFDIHSKSTGWMDSLMSFFNKKI